MKIFIILLLILILVSLVGSYTAPSYNSVNFTLVDNYIAPSYTSVNLTLGLVVDTCTYVSNDWNVNCADNCVIATETNLNGNNLILEGSGSFTIESDILNIKNITIVNTCDFIKGAGNFTIMKN